MPQIPGVSGPGAGPRRGFKPMRLVGFLAGLLILLVCVRWLMRPRGPAAAPAAAPPQIEVPAPTPDPNAALPQATESDPGVARVDEMAAPWTSKDFFYRNRLSGENVPAVLIRLPIASASQAASYWAFSLNSPFGHCRLEYVTDLSKLKSEYGYHNAKHPMVGNPCTRTVFDPLKMMNLPGSVWVRGAIVQGSDLRPPLGIEVEIRGKEILAARME